MLMSNQDRPARLHYMANGFRMMAPGGYVLCAVSGAKIPVDELRYWDVRTQRPFASAEISVQALSGK